MRSDDTRVCDVGIMALRRDPSRSFHSLRCKAVIILGLDTADQSGSVALVNETQILASFYLRQAPTLSSQLLRIVDAVCGQAGYCLDDLEGLAVGLGPGGFTSLRVGLATAQGLAIATGKRLVGCSAFEALVALVEGWNGAVCPVLEARRGEVYAAFYQRQGAVMHETTPGMVTTPDRLCSMVTEQTLLVGSGVRAYGALFTATLGARAICLEGIPDGGLAASVARVGHGRLCASTPTAWPALKPLYIRAADARLPRHAMAAAEETRLHRTSGPGE